MRRLLTYIGLGLLGLVLLLLGMVFLLPKTPIGQSWIDGLARPRIERAVEAQLGSDIRYDRISGALPGEIILTNLAIRQDGEDWLTAERLVLEWHPFALTGKQINIEHLTGHNIILYRLPVMPEKELESTDDQDRDDDGDFPLPKVRLGRLSINSFSIREPVFGERYDLTFSGDARLDGKQARANLALDTLSDSDSIRLGINFDGKGLTLITSALSAPDGLVTTALSAEDTVWLTLEGEGPLENWQGVIETSVGNYGSLSGQLGGDLVSFRDAKFALDLLPGPLLPEEAAAYLGETLHVTGETRREEDRIVLTLSDAHARFGRIAGTLGLPIAGHPQFTADLDGLLSEEIATELGMPLAAGPVSLDGQLTRGNKGMSFDGNLTTGVAALAVTEGQHREGMLFEGQIHLTADDFPFENERFADVLKGGGEITTRATVTEELAVSLSNLTARLGADRHRITLSGNADYNRTDGAIEATLAGRAGPAVTALILGQPVFEAATPFRLSADGTLDAVKADITIQYPDGKYQETAFSSGVLSANLTGLPKRPGGRVGLLARDESYQGGFNLASTEENYRVSELAFRSGGFTLTGEADYRPGTGAAEARLLLDAPEPTTLITGETLAGKASLVASYRGDGGQLEANADIEALRYGSIDIQKAALTAKGPLRELTTTLTASNAALPGVYLARTEVSSLLRLDGDRKSARIDRLRLSIDEDTEERRITLLEPVEIGFSDGLTLSPARLDWLGDSKVEANGRFAPDRWQGNVKLTGVEVPGLIAPVTGTLALDTSSDTPARFEASANASPEDSDKTYALTAEGVWSGDTLHLISQLSEQGGTALVSADIDWPVILTRKDGKLAIDLPDRAIDGTVTAKGEIDPLYAFLPAVPPYFTGKLDGRMTLSGTSAAPILDGDLKLTDGRFEEPIVGVTMTELTGDISLGYGPDRAGGRFDITGAGATGRDKSVSLQGTVELAGEKSRIDSKLVLDDATIVDGPTLKVRTNADLVLAGSLDELSLSGLIEIGQIDSGIPEATNGNGNGDPNTPSYPEVNVVRVDGPAPELADLERPQTSAPAVSLNLQVRADNEIFLRGRGLDTEWRANFDVAGTSATPLIDGDVILRRGSLNFAGRNFDFERGRIEFRPSNKDLATVNARAVYERDEASAFINVGGTVMAPEITLSSTPVMPEEDIMALILFGKQPTELSALESLQIANALRSLAGVGPSFGSGTGLSSAIGLDALSFGIDEATGEGVVAVGKYISDDIYVSARQTARGTSSEVTVTYEVTDDITVESTLQPNGAQDVSVNYKKDY